MKPKHFSDFRNSFGSSPKETLTAKHRDQQFFLPITDEQSSNPFRKTALLSPESQLRVPASELTTPNSKMRAIDSRKRSTDDSKTHKVVFLLKRKIQQRKQSQRQSFDEIKVPRQTYEQSVI